MATGLRRLQPLILNTATRALANAAAATATSAVNGSSKYPPPKFVDAHHYFFDPDHNEFNSFLKATGAPPYLPEQYKTDVIEPLSKMGIGLEGTVHVEMTDDGESEVRWVQSMIDANRCDHVKAIVGYCDLTAPDAEEKLQKLKAVSDKVRGVRVILDHEGGETALGTHVAFKPRKSPVNYLKEDAWGDINPKFEKGVELLSKYGLSFDALCRPDQLPKVAKLFKWHGDVNVCIDHLGKPRTFMDESGNSKKGAVPSEEEIRVWRQGMQAMADLPNSYVKLSMMGYTAPGWVSSPEREEVLRDLVYETVDRFGPERVMIGTNYHISDANADSDGIEEETEAPNTAEFVDHLSSWFEDLSETERENLFCDTAKRFYKI